MRTLRIAACILSNRDRRICPVGRAKIFRPTEIARRFMGREELDGQPVQVSYRMTAGGSALMSEIVGHGETMISMINFDGPNRLLLTHYCAVGNQPRMQASASPDGKTITFNFLDATNLDSPQSGHMDHVVIAMLGPDHHTEEWNFIDHGKEIKEFFDLTRKIEARLFNV